jgi:hypothetical protein
VESGVVSAVLYFQIDDDTRAECVAHLLMIVSLQDLLQAI